MTRPTRAELTAAARDAEEIADVFERVTRRDDTVELSYEERQRYAEMLRGVQRTLLRTVPFTPVAGGLACVSDHLPDAFPGATA